jgi:hypothetical protein
MAAPFSVSGSGMTLYHRTHADPELGYVEQYVELFQDGSAVGWEIYLDGSHSADQHYDGESVDSLVQRGYREVA